MKPEEIKVGMEFEDRGNRDRIIRVTALEPVNGPGADYAYVTDGKRQTRIKLSRLSKPWKYRPVEKALGVPPGTTSASYDGDPGAH
jgi:hypothetical protein